MKLTFVLVNSQFKTLLCQTQPTVKKYIEKDSTHRIFRFNQKEQALQFKSQIDNNPSLEQLAILQKEYYADQILQTYINKMNKLLTPKVEDNNQDGVSIQLIKKRKIFVVQQDNDYPKLYFNQTTIKKNNFDENQVAMFQDSQSAIDYLKQLIIKVQNNKNTNTNTNTNTQDTPITTDLTLEQLDIKYKELLHFYKDPLPFKGQIDPLQTYYLKCSFFSTLHYHSAIGFTVSNANATDTLKQQGMYTGQKYADSAYYLAILFGLRSCILNKLQTVTCQLANPSIYQALTNMVQIKQFKIQIYFNAIKEYNQLIKTNYELVSKEDVELAHKQAVKAFQKHTYLAQRQRKLWSKTKYKQDDDE